MALGYPDQALKSSHEALTLAQECAPLQPGFCPELCCHTPSISAERSKPAQERAEAAIALLTEQGFPLFLPLGTALRGWALADRAAEEGVTQMRQGLAA